ncbi:hypothetical protein N7U66_17415 [Lacinutrix neustonica]|uniref:Uncharacterized protein n=1 Tax=Lacinutrix neustonica TaxID=2980107 RepID=A0A9E8SDF1_9FLAO|nr:hypothetical protein [Lacinutrix neustonica]WAC01682.1 hypothetical protein N7U66_17415 [Lacinutrix neustonica]
MGEEKYLSDGKRLSFSVRAYLVTDKTKISLLSYLENKNLDGDWMPRNQGHYGKLFNREKFRRQRSFQWKKNQYGVK